MLSVTIAMLLLQPSAAPDPLTRRMIQFCRARPACVVKQRQGVKRFLRVITQRRPSQALVQNCLKRASKRQLTDWSKAAECLELRARTRRR